MTWLLFAAKAVIFVLSFACATLIVFGPYIAACVQEWERSRKDRGRK